MYSHFTQLILEFDVFFGFSPAEWWNNCGVYRKSTKFGTMIVYDIMKNIGYGLHPIIPNTVDFISYTRIPINGNGDNYR